MKQGAIIVNGYFENDATINQCERLKEKFFDRGVIMDVIKNNNLTAYVGGVKPVDNILPYDFIVYLDKDLHVAKLLEKLGFRLFNSAAAIEVCDDKMVTFISLVNRGIPMPKTISAPIMYSDVTDNEFLEKVKKIIDYPIVVKKVHGSMGKQVYLAKNDIELQKIYNDLKAFPHIYQEYLGKGYGRDIRVITVGGKVVSAMERVNKTDFRSNIEAGGIGQKVELNDTQRALAEAVSSILKLDYAGVDIIEKDGVNYLLEVNSNAFFKGIEQVTGVDVADAYAEYITNKIYR